MKQYTNDELNEFEIMVDDTIKWMFSRPNDRHTILSQIKKAYNLGEERAIGLCQSEFDMKKESLSLSKFEEIKKKLNLNS